MAHTDINFDYLILLVQKFSDGIIEMKVRKKSKWSSIGDVHCQIKI